MDIVAAVASAPPFVARVGQLARLHELLTAASSGRAGAVIIGGDAGLGKTRLIGELTHEAEQSGFEVFVGRCVDLGTGALPYLPFADALSEPLRRTGTPPGQTRSAGIVREAAQENPGLAQILGIGGPSVSTAAREVGLDRLGLFESVTRTLSRITVQVAPLVLVLEDLHWADASTRDLVRFLFSRLGSDRLLVLASFRKDDLHRRHPLRPLLGELVRLPGVESMDLPPLSRTELGELLGGVSEAPIDPDRLRGIAARSAGNPYYAQELMACGEGGRLPGELTDLLLDRLEQLSAATQRLVRLAAVMGSARISDRLLRSVAEETAAIEVGGDANRIEESLREAIAHQVLVPEETDRYRFRHALLQEAVYTDLLPGERVRLHRAVASGLKRLPVDQTGPGTSAEVARHSLAASDIPSALNASLEAARAAARACAPAEALQHYEQALQLWDVVADEQRCDPTPRSRISLRAAQTALDAGLGQRSVALAATALEEARAEGDRAAAASALAALSLHTYLIDRPHEAYEHALQVIRDLSGDDAATPPRALAWSTIARIRLGMGDPEQAVEAVVSALAEAQNLGMTELQIELLTTQAVAEGMLGRHEDSARSFRLAKAAAELADDAAGAVRVLNNIAINDLDVGDLTAGAHHLEAAIQVADASGLTAGPSGTVARQLLITTYWRAGDVERALGVLRPDTDSSLPSGLMAYLKVFELPVMAARDPRSVLGAEDWAVLGNIGWEHQVLHDARAEALTWLGRHHEAADEAAQALEYVLSDAEPWPLAGIAIDVRGVSALADAVEEARKSGDQQAEEASLARIVPFVQDGRSRERLGRPRRGEMGPEGHAWLCRLNLEEQRARGVDTARGWLDVAEKFDEVAVFEAGRARWRAACRLLDEGRCDEAGQTLRLAYATALRLGAEPLRQAVEVAAQKAGIGLPGCDRQSVSTESGSRAPSGSAAALTPREREVMDLVAEGLTNRLIGRHLQISEKTVSVHISNVLTKLGASGRTEAVAIMSRTGLIT